eukprot:442801_1
MFALKIFENSLECLHEIMILNRIKVEFYTDNVHSINVPKIVSDTDISCENHSAILMQYIDGINLEHTQIEPNILIRLWEQISDVIIRLGNKGIGHFDIHEWNILVDTRGNFWLIDFGCGIIITHNITQQFKIFPKWLYYSPQAYQLSKMIKKISQSVRYNITATD